MIALLLLLPSRDAQACGALCGIPGFPPCPGPDAFRIGGPVIYIGSADQWNAAEDAGLIFELTQAATAGGPGIDLIPLVPGPGAHDTATAATHLRAVGVELGSPTRMDLTRSGIAEVFGYPDIHSWTVTSIEARVGGLQFQEFMHRRMHSKSDCSSPWLDRSAQDLCNEVVGSAAVQMSGWGANPGLTFPPWTPIELAGDTAVVFPDPPYDDLGLRFSAAHAGVGIWFPGSYWIDPKGFLLFDLEVPDLPQAWKNEYGDTVRVAAHIYGGSIYTYTYVPAMSMRGSSILVIAVLAVGLLALTPFRRPTPRL